jgi:putative phosphoribosyl transferase
MFADRVQAGRLLAERLGHLRAEPVVVLGLPRGGVPVAAEVARALGAPLDVIVVRKLGVPFHRELAMGAIGEGGVRVMNDEVVVLADVTEREVAQVEERERAELERRARRLRGERPPVALPGHVAVIVDDGIATGSTARAACAVARAPGATRVVVAVPVAPRDWIDQMSGAADEYVCVETPEPFVAVGQFYADFSEVSDDAVAACLQRTALRPPVTPARPLAEPCDDEVTVDVGAGLAGRLTVPEQPCGVVLFAHGSGSGRHSPRNRFVASTLNRAGLGTLLFDLLTPAEERDRRNVFDIELLGERLAGATGWLRSRPEAAGLPVGYFGASTGAGAALWAAADADVAAVVSRGGRPDLAGHRLRQVRAPTLLIVGGADPVVLELNRTAQAELRCESRLTVVPGATHLFEEPGTLQFAAEAARDWFTSHLTARRDG